MYTVREMAQSDFLGAYRAVAALGYPAVQPAGTGGLSAVEFKRALDDMGVTVAGNHVSLDALETRLDDEIGYYLELGTPDLVISVIPQPRRQNLDGYLQVFDSMAKIGARCKELGARLHYHNHAFEFEKFDGVSALDTMFSRIPADLVKWEPDVYWVKVGGEDPAAMIRKYSGRTPIIHLKDMTAGESPTFAEVGEGILDWESVFAASEASGAQFYVVEQDRASRPPLEAAKMSLENLKKWGKL